MECWYLFFFFYLTLSILRSIFQYIFHILFIFVLNSQSLTVDVSILLHIKTINRRILTFYSLLEYIMTRDTTHSMKILWTPLQQIDSYLSNETVKSTLILRNQLNIHFSYPSKIVAICTMIPQPPRPLWFLLFPDISPWGLRNNLVNVNRYFNIILHRNVSGSKHTNKKSYVNLTQCMGNLIILASAMFTYYILCMWNDRIDIHSQSIFKSFSF